QVHDWRSVDLSYDLGILRDLLGYGYDVCAEMRLQHPWLFRNFPIPSTCAIHRNVLVNRILSNPDILPAVRSLCRSKKRSMTPPDESRQTHHPCCRDWRGLGAFSIFSTSKIVRTIPDRS